MGDYTVLLSNVTVYSESGYMDDLPNLNEGRYDHGCSYYLNDDNTKVVTACHSSPHTNLQTYLVTGGFNRSTSLSSTELLRAESSEWEFTGQLPTPRFGLRGANIDGRILMTGNI